MNIRQLKQKSKELHHSLSQKNDYKMTDMIMYLRGKDLSAYHIELLRYDFLEKAAAAEAAGKAIETTFGFDLREYVDQRVSELPPMTDEEEAYEFFKLWGFAAVFLIGASIAFDLLFDYIARANGNPSAGTWSVTYTEVFMLLIIIGIAFTLGSLFTKHKLEKDPDFFSKGSRNHLKDFFRIYGLTLVIILAGFGLMYLFRDNVLYTLPMTTAVILWVILALAYLVIRLGLSARVKRE